MTRSLICSFCVTMLALMGAGCAAKSPAMFQPVDLNPQVIQGYLEPKVDNFLIILDVSGSMAEVYGNEKKFAIACNTARNIVASLPDMEVNGGLRVFGHSMNLLASKTDLLIDVAKLDKKRFFQALDGITWASGKSPLAGAIAKASDDLERSTGNIAVFIVSDGRESDGEAARAAEVLKNTYGDRLCIYPILVGDDPQGMELFERLVIKGRCGFAQSAGGLVCPGAAACYVARVFMEKGPDEDGDGAPDKIDQCPQTVQGAMVNEIGCWQLNGLQFETNKAAIAKQYRPVIDCAVAILGEHPDLKIKIVGHTDSTGPQAFNQALSLKRAKAVMDYMVKKGVDAGRLQAVGAGSSQPLGPDDTEEGKAKNRRVSITPMK